MGVTLPGRQQPVPRGVCRSGTAVRGPEASMCSRTA